ncbi:hypothetical protein F5Y10DRAFT_210365 [Nemania abortiva]|nr:hypothetical protein F5Y10DRAFT_210365 [Nemania abortiva]
MIHVPYDEESPQREEDNIEVSSRWSEFRIDTMSVMEAEHHCRNQPRGSPQYCTIHDPSDWVPVGSPDSEDDICRTPLTDVESVRPTSPASRSPYSDDPNRDEKKLALAEADLRDSREQGQCQALVIKAQEKYISNLDTIANKERKISQSLGAKLSDLFIMVTQNQQHELDRVQRRLLDLQTDAEDCLLGHEWRDLQEKLHNLNRKLDGYIKLTTPQSISAGTQTDELTLFLSSLLGELPKMSKELRKLKRDIEEEKARYAEDDLQSQESAPERVTSETTTREDVDSASATDQPSVTDILDRYYEFSRIHRERMVMRQQKLQSLLDLISTELGRLQADLAYEEGRTGNMKTRMMFWGDDLDASKVKSPNALMENLEMKLSTLESGSKELEQIAKIVQNLPSHFHMIDIHIPEEEKASTDSETSAVKGANKSLGAQDHASVAGQREDTMYIVELEAKLKEKQANEKAWAAHFENLHQRESEAKAALQKQLDAIELGNAELRKVVKTVAGKLFEHRERLWGLSKPARQIGEELISTLEQLEITCDEPLVYCE